MRTNGSIRGSLLGALGGLIIVGLAAPRVGAAESAPGDKPAAVVFLVRHAEKTAGDGYGRARDPRLTEAGRARAEALARLLGPSGITAVHSTDYRRTRETARPLAEALGLGIERYDARMLERFAEALRRQPGRHLVVGHSNTTTALVDLLGGNAGEPIDDASEYDRLYVLVLGPDGRVTTIRQHYGAPSGRPER